VCLESSVRCWLYKHTYIHPLTSVAVSLLFTDTDIRAVSHKLLLSSSVVVSDIDTFRVSSNELESKSRVSQHIFVPSFIVPTYKMSCTTDNGPTILSLPSPAAEKGKAPLGEAAEQAVEAFRPARVFVRAPASQSARRANKSVEAAQALTSQFLEEAHAARQLVQEPRQPQPEQEKSEQPQPDQEKPQQKKPEQEERRSSQQPKGKDLAALCSGSPTYSVSAGAVSSA
jgi:hypothetical protein